MGCPHARPDWRMCPWCLGVNDIKLSKEDEEKLKNGGLCPEKKVRGKPINPSGGA